MDVSRETLSIVVEMQDLFHVKHVYSRGVKGMFHVKHWDGTYAFHIV